MDFFNRFLSWRFITKLCDIAWIFLNSYFGADACQGLIGFNPEEILMNLNGESFNVGAWILLHDATQHKLFLWVLNEIDTRFLQS